MTDSRARAVLAAMVIAWAALFTLLGGIQLRSFLTRDVDLAIFTQAVDHLLAGSFHNSIRGMNWLGDHSSLNLFLVAPFYALVPAPLTLIGIQSLALALGAIPLYALARREFERPGPAVACAALYLLQPALGFVARFEFHPEALAVAPLLASFYYLRAGRGGAALAFAALALLAKEDVALVVLGLAAYGALALGRRRSALGLAALAAASLALSFAVLKPALSAGEAEYGRMYAAFGEGAGGIAAGLAKDPLRAIATLFSTPGDPADTRLKLTFWFQLLAPVALLALASPAVLLIALPVLAEHLLSSRAQQHTIAYQYTALILPFVIAAAVLGARRLSRGDAPRAVAPVALALVAALVSQAAFGPLRARVLPTGIERAEARTRAALLRRLPPAGGVVAGFEFLPHLARRDSLHALHHVAIGRFTYSRRAYPTPEGVVALLADFGSARFTPYVDDSTAARLAILIRRNHLVPVDARGDLVLFQSGVTAASLFQSDAAPAPGPVVRYDGLEFRGARLDSSRVAPGGLLGVATSWRRTGPLPGLAVLRLVVRDPAGGIRHQHVRYLGYVFAPPGLWPEDLPLRERYRLVLPDDLAPGRYTLAMQLGWRRGANVAVDAGDGAGPDGVIPLGGFEVGTP